MRLRKGSVSYGLGADFSLPHCLVGDKGIGKQLGTISSRHKRSAGAKSRGESSWYGAPAKRPGGTAVSCIFLSFSAILS